MWDKTKGVKSLVNKTELMKVIKSKGYTVKDISKMAQISKNLLYDKINGKASLSFQKFIHYVIF